MNEEEAILDFFSRPENLSLALSAAEQMDKLREQFNNRLWRELHARLNALVGKHELEWRIELTEDKNAPECLVGLHCTLPADQSLYLHPMMEQQFLGGEWRIYFGLIWSAASSPGQLGLASVLNLKASLQKAGYKSNETFLAWKWTAFHPRRKDFLLRYANHAEKLLEDVLAIFATLLLDHREAIDHANEMLRTSQPPGLSASLEQLRNELLD
ncbi:MAG: hypothetical protein WB444_11775 [Gallionella sp.]